MLSKRVGAAFGSFLVPIFAVIASRDFLYEHRFFVSASARLNGAASPVKSVPIHDVAEVA